MFKDHAILTNCSRFEELNFGGPRGMCLCANQLSLIVDWGHVHPEQFEILFLRLILRQTGK